MDLCDLPDELLVHIISYLDDGFDLARICIVARRFKTIATDEKLWMMAARKRWKHCRMSLYYGWKHFFGERSKVCKPVCNRIVVLGTCGNIFTINPDGTDKRMITNDASIRKRYQQPTWSPLADRIAFSSRNSKGDSHLITCDIRGKNLTVAPAKHSPFYIYWAPDDTRLMFISSFWVTERAFGLFIVDVAKGGKEATLVEYGMPVYFTWSNHPHDSRIMTHISGDRFELVHILEGNTPRGPSLEILPPATPNPLFPHLKSRLSTFSCPIWLSSTDRVIYTVCAFDPNDEHALYLVMSPLGRPDQELILARCRAQTSFHYAVSPDEKLLAFSQDDGGVHILVLDSTNPAVLVSRDAVVAFFWGPNSRYLLFASLEIGQRCFYWGIYDHQRRLSYRLSSFIPSKDLMNNYFPFFSQYNLSMTVFSPNSQHFVYPDFSGVIMIHGVSEGAKAIPIVHGTFASWSPL